MISSYVNLQYSEKRIADYQKPKERIFMGTKSCIKFWCNKNDVTSSSFSEKKQAMISEIDETNQPPIYQSDNRKKPKHIKT